MSSEHVEVLWAMLRKCVNERLARKSADREAAALAAAIEALKSAPQPPAEAQTELSGMEKAFSSEIIARREQRQGLVPPTPVAALAPQPPAEAQGWYCAHCRRGVDAREVTYSEQHEVCGRYIANDDPPPSAPVGVEDIAVELERYADCPGSVLALAGKLRALAQQPAAHPAITHCDNCGCDWLDNGLNPIGCPYCKPPATPSGEAVALLERSLAVIQHDIDEIGGCDHSVGICCCELIHLADDIRAALAQQPAAVDEVLAAVRSEVARATAKFPTWPTDPLHASGVVQEESGELAKAVLQVVYEPHKSTPEDAATEAFQTAAMAVRFLMSMDRYKWVPGDQHEQPAALAAQQGGRSDD